MPRNMNNPDLFHENFEQRFGCCICLGPKLEMVSGQCQHRICADCLYSDGKRRPCMLNCPMCGFSNSFPVKRPTLPQEVLDIQRVIGVQACTKGCGTQMWFWEVEDHQFSCPKAEREPTPIKSKSRVSRRRVSDLGPVSITRWTRSKSKKGSNRYGLRRRDSTIS